MKDLNELCNHLNIIVDGLIRGLLLIFLVKILF